MKELELVEFMLGRIKCTKWFDQDGRIVVDGPTDEINKIAFYTTACNEFCQDPGFLSCATNIQANTKHQLTAIKHAIVDVMYDKAVEASQSGHTDATFTIEEVRRRAASIKIISKASH
jgi:hypothetical protein